MGTEKFIGKILGKIAKTKDDALGFGGLFVGFALGMACFCPGDDSGGLGLTDIVVFLAASVLLFAGVILIDKGREHNE